jgi:hypothetical protein
LTHKRTNIQFLTVHKFTSMLAFETKFWNPSLLHGWNVKAVKETTNSLSSQWPDLLMAAMCSYNAELHYVGNISPDRPPLWSSGQSSCLKIHRFGFDFRCYQIFWEVVGLQRGPVSLVSTSEELLQRKSSSCGLDSRECGRRDQLCWQRDTFYPQRLALTSTTSCGCNVEDLGIYGKTIKWIIKKQNGKVRLAWSKIDCSKYDNTFRIKFLEFLESLSKY